MQSLAKLKKLLRKKPSKIDHLQTFHDDSESSTKWWGKHQVEEGQSRVWRVGNVTIFVDRFTNEWNIASTPVANVKADDKESKTDDDEDKSTAPNLESLKFTTYTFKTQAEIELSPVLPDKHLASTLDRPFHIPAGEEIVLYVSSPVWVRLETGASKILLEEIPTFILSETWLGPNTIEGKLCYAGYTYCAPHLKDVPSGPDRIISPMLIRNNSKTMLVLEKISVPLPYLSVYSDSKNYLWTEQLTVKSEGEASPSVQVAKGPPKALKEIQKLSSARRELHATTGLVNFFSHMMRH